MSIKSSAPKGNYHSIKSTVNGLINRRIPELGRFPTMSLKPHSTLSIHLLLIRQHLRVNHMQQNMYFLKQDFKWLSEQLYFNHPTDWLQIGLRFLILASARRPRYRQRRYTNARRVAYAHLRRRS